MVESKAQRAIEDVRSVLKEYYKIEEEHWVNTESVVDWTFNPTTNWHRTSCRLKVDAYTYLELYFNSTPDLVDASLTIHNVYIDLMELPYLKHIIQHLFEIMKDPSPIVIDLVPRNKKSRSQLDQHSIPLIPKRSDPKKFSITTGKSRSRSRSKSKPRSKKGAMRDPVMRLED